MREFFRDWIKCVTGLAAFVPFLIMLLIHRTLGVSIALLAKPSSIGLDWPIYNLVMMLVLYAGFLGYFVYLVISIPARNTKAPRDESTSEKTN